VSPPFCLRIRKRHFLGAYLNLGKGICLIAPTHSQVLPLALAFSIYNKQTNKY
jgi:hypothetical protein